MEQNVRYYSRRCKGRQGCTCSSVSFWPWRSARWCHGWLCKGQPLRAWAQAVGLVLCLGLCLAATEGLAGEVSASPASPLADTAWLASQLSAAQLRVVDLRAAGDYQKGHIPRAVHLEAGTLVEAQPVEQGRRFALAALAERIGRLGIGDTTEVVAYDDQGGLNAARLWWLLTSAGHSSVRVLDGGWDKWQREKRPVTTEVIPPAPVTFTVRYVAGFFATKEDV